MHLWQYSKVTGYWRIARDVTPETAQHWLAIYRKDEPNEHFKVSARRPINNPTRGAPKREKNKRRPCVRKVTRARPARSRKRARAAGGGRVGLFAQRSGGPVLAFMGRGKFAGRGRPKVFKSRAAAAAVGWALRDSFPRRLKGYRLFTK